MQAKCHAGGPVIEQEAVREKSIGYERDIQCRLCERKLKECMQYRC